MNFSLDLNLIQKVFLVIIITLDLILGIKILFSNKNSIKNRLFFFSSVSIVLWMLTGFLVYYPQLANFTLFVGRLNYGFVILWLVCIFLFIRNFPKEVFKTPIIDYVYTFFGIIFAILATFTSLLVKEIPIENINAKWIMGPLEYPFYIFSILTAILIIGILITKYYKASIKNKARLRLVIYGGIIVASFNIIFNVLIPSFFPDTDYFWIGDFSFVFFLGFTAYAIVKHKLFDIRVIATEVIVVLLSIGLFVQIFIYQNITEAVIKAIIWALATYGGVRLIQSVKIEIEHRREIERLAGHLERTNKNLLTLQHINNKMVSTLDVKKVSQEIVESLATELSWKGGFLALINEEKEKIYIEAITYKIGRKVAPLLKKPIYKYSLSVRGSESIIQKSIHRLEIEFTDSLDELINGAIEPKDAQKIQKKLHIETFSSSPIVYRGKVIGVLISGFTKPVSKITDEEKKMISSISDQAAIAIENAKLYQEVEKANIKLKELDKLKNEFLSIASHQVRTPLSIIKGYISLLRTKKAGELSAQQERFMKNIQEANEQLINIINDFLNLSRIEQKRMKLEISKSDIKKIINEVMERLSHEAELKKIKIVFSKPTTTISKINIDEPKIIEVITNLIDNAIKYSPENSKVEVRVKKKDNFLDISVKDSGIGIPEDFKDKLFQKFSRAHNAIQAQPNGNGIGLFLVKKIIDAHRGQIIVKTKEGKGTIFTIKLNYKSGLKPGEEVDANKLEKEGIIRYNEYKQ